MGTIHFLDQARLDRMRRQFAAGTAEIIQANRRTRIFLEASAAGLQAVRVELDAAQQSLAAGQAFRNACRDAWELDDLDEMIRRRDALAWQLTEGRPPGPAAPPER